MLVTLKPASLKLAVMKFQLLNVKLDRRHKDKENDEYDFGI